MTELESTDLLRSADIQSTTLTSTAEVEPLHVPIAQQRAMEAIGFSMAMSFDGYNLYALGSSKTDKRSIILEQLKMQAANQPRPLDYCYLENFDDPGQPILVELLAGEGKNFRKHMQEFISAARVMIPSAFESEDYRQTSQALIQDFQKSQSSDAAELENEAREMSLAMLPTPNGFAFAPIADGKVIEHEQFLNLDEEERQKYQQAIVTMTEKLVDRLQDYPAQQQKLVEKQQTLRQETAGKVIKRLLARIRTLYEANEHISSYLTRCEQELLKNLDKLVETEKSASLPSLLGAPNPEAFFSRFEVNLFVDASSLHGAPVIYESNPSLENLVGKLDHRVEYGNLVTDFSQVRAGALHRANNGYLVLDAERLIQKPFAWEALKRALNDHCIRIESVSQLLNMTYSVSLEPEPVPLNVKVVLLGSRHLYHLLRQYDPDFDDLFKIVADFADHVTWNDESVKAYIALLAKIVQDTGIQHLDADAVGRVLEYCSRQVEDRGQLSTHVSEIRDLVLEADFLAKSDNAALISRCHISDAINKRTHRLDRFREMIQENISRGIIRVETCGRRVGQVNGLSVVNIGQMSFGQPSRITATARLGRGELVDIEREAHLGGDIHSKAVMIVSAYLGAKYARYFPLSLHASLVFEQAYAGVEGDSASIAEVCALLSAITDMPIRQSIAITGSMDQHGFAQAIGGVNQKIEGFFYICQQQGLDGTHGVIVPAANKHHLMLNEDVVSAVKHGLFHIYTIENVDDAASILLSSHTEKKTIAEINETVITRLHEFHDKAKQAHADDSADKIGDESETKNTQVHTIRTSANLGDPNGP